MILGSFGKKGVLPAMKNKFWGFCWQVQINIASCEIWYKLHVLTEILNRGAHSAVLLTLYFASSWQPQYCSNSWTCIKHIVMGCSTNFVRFFGIFLYGFVCYFWHARKLSASNSSVFYFFRVVTSGMLPSLEVRPPVSSSSLLQWGVG